MVEKKKIYAYFDGSNFYHLSNLNYKFSNILFNKLTQQLLKPNEELVKIKYFNSPINQQEEPENYTKQQKFFEKLKETPLLELNLGRLVKRPINKINLICKNCGSITVETLECPKCKFKTDISKVYKTTEKGIDIQLAISLLLDALNNNYDAALLFSGDADFVPAINYIISTLKKEVIFCRFPKPRTNALINSCSNTRLITREMLLTSRLDKK